MVKRFGEGNSRDSTEPVSEPVAEQPKSLFDPFTEQGDDPRKAVLGTSVFGGEPSHSQQYIDRRYAEIENVLTLDDTTADEIAKLIKMYRTVLATGGHDKESLVVFYDRVQELIKDGKPELIIMGLVTNVSYLLSRLGGK